jgi:hypothetical protein
VSATTHECRFPECYPTCELVKAARATDDEMLPLELCVCGEHFYCPDGWHSGDDLPCSCTPDCALPDDEGDV